MKPLIQFFSALLLITLNACAESPTDESQTQAQMDIQAGKPEYRVYGEPMRDEQILAEILKAKYSVILHRVAGCIVTEDQLSQTKAYNAIIAGHLNKVYHKDVFAAASAEYVERLKTPHQEPSRSAAPQKP